MCIVSAISDHFMQWPMEKISIDAYNGYLQLKKTAMQLDEELNQPDCVKPEVEEWEKEVIEELKKRGEL